MQLTARDVARLFSVTESTIEQWVRKRGLPARKILSQYRFNPVDLLEWATEHQAEVDHSLFSQKELSEADARGLSEALENGGIFHELGGHDREGALSAFVNKLRLPNETDRGLLLELLKSRELCGSTAIGDGIAVPHVRNPIVLHVSAPMVALGYLSQPVDFAAPDGKPVSVLFTLICPTVRCHLRMLTRLSSALRDPQFQAAVQRHAPDAEILKEARRLDSAIVSVNSAGQVA